MDRPGEEIRTDDHEIGYGPTAVTNPTDSAELAIRIVRDSVIRLQADQVERHQAIRTEDSLRMIDKVRTGANNVASDANEQLACLYHELGVANGNDSAVRRSIDLGKIVADAAYDPFEARRRLAVAAAIEQMVECRQGAKDIIFGFCSKKEKGAPSLSMRRPRY
jgi:hypothetical protein